MPNSYNIPPIGSKIILSMALGPRHVRMTSATICEAKFQKSSATSPDSGERDELWQPGYSRSGLFAQTAAQGLCLHHNHPISPRSLIHVAIQAHSSRRRVFGRSFLGASRVSRRVTYRDKSARPKLLEGLPSVSSFCLSSNNMYGHSTCMPVGASCSLESALPYSSDG